MKIDKSVVIRVAILLVALINQGLTVAGHSLLPISNDQITETISILFLIATSFWTAWKNNSITSGAKYGDKIIAAIKAGLVTIDEVDKFLEDKNSSES